jgi:hypothetical protein
MVEDDDDVDWHSDSHKIRSTIYLLRIRIFPRLSFVSRTGSSTNEHGFMKCDRLVSVRTCRPSLSMYGLNSPSSNADEAGRTDVLDKSEKVNSFGSSFTDERDSSSMRLVNASPIIEHETCRHSESTFTRRENKRTNKYLFMISLFVYNIAQNVAR